METELTEIITIFANSIPMVHDMHENLSDSNLIRHLTLLFPFLPSSVESIINSLIYKCQQMSKFIEISILTFSSIARITLADMRRSTFNYCKRVILSLPILRQFSLFCLQKVIYIALETRPEIFRDEFTYSPFPCLAYLLEELMPNHPLFLIAKTMYNEYKQVAIFIKFEALTREKVKNIIYNSRQDENNGNFTSDSFEYSLGENESKPKEWSKKDKKSLNRRTNLPETHLPKHGDESNEEMNTSQNLSIKSKESIQINLDFKTMDEFISYFMTSNIQLTQMFHNLIFMPEIKIINEIFFAFYFNQLSSINELYMFILDPFGSEMPQDCLKMFEEKFPNYDSKVLPISNVFPNNDVMFKYKPKIHNAGLFRSSITVAFLVKYLHHKQLFGLHKNYFGIFSFLKSRKYVNSIEKGQTLF